MNITLAGENTYRIGIRMKSSTDRFIYSQTNPCTKCLRKCIKHVDRRIKPSLQSLVGVPGLAELVDLVLKYGKNIRSRVACLELSSERMSGEVLFSLPFIFFEGFFEDDCEIGT